MKKLIAKFDKRISVSKLDEQIQKLVQNFPENMSVLIKCRMTSKHMVAILEERNNTITSFGFLISTKLMFQCL
jgi:hypothetical protein